MNKDKILSKKDKTSKVEKPCHQKSPYPQLKHTNPKMKSFKIEEYFKKIDSHDY